MMQPGCFRERWDDRGMGRWGGRVIRVDGGCRAGHQNCLGSVRGQARLGLGQPREEEES